MMPAHKGTRPPGGSRKGIPNKTTKALKDMILAALDAAGGEAYLARQAVENPGPFMTLIGKVLPTQVTGPGDGPVQHEMTIEARQAATKAILDEAFGKEGE
jgi:hypothetical protein